MANVAIGASTLRNQGAPGVNNAVRHFLFGLDLATFVGGTESRFREDLDRQTDLLVKRLPPGAQHWGTARKSLNLFLGEAYYHRFLCSAYGLDHIEHYLEVPLDRQVAQFLIDRSRETGAGPLPGWRGIIHLTPEASQQYQDFAAKYAESLDGCWARVHLDVIAWRGSPGTPD